MNNTRKNDDAIMKVLDVTTIRRFICNTDKGLLELMIRKGETNYFLTLDAVPLDKQTNKELMDLMFKPEVKETVIDGIKADVVMFKGFDKLNPLMRNQHEDIEKIPAITPGKKKGRPKGSKNGVKI